jgi:CRP/FNR family transcriptional regulator
MAPISAKVVGLCDAARERDHLPQECASCVARHLAACAGLSPNELSHLAQFVTHRRLDAGQTLFQEDDAADNVFTVTSGLFKQYKLLADGRCQVTGFYFAGDLIGLPDGPDYPVTAEALTTATVCGFPRGRITELVGRYPSLASAVILKLQREITAAQGQMLSLGRLTAEERIAGFLLALLDKAPDCVNDDGSLRLNMRRADIADYLGLTVETVSRSFTKLRNAGVIGAERSGVVEILSRDGLADVAQGPG